MFNSICLPGRPNYMLAILKNRLETSAESVITGSRIVGFLVAMSPDSSIIHLLSGWVIGNVFGLRSLSNTKGVRRQMVRRRCGRVGRGLKAHPNLGGDGNQPFLHGINTT